MTTARPTDLDRELTFCPAAQAGACCTAEEEEGVQQLFESAGDLTAECADLYQQVLFLLCDRAKYPSSVFVEA